MKFLYLLVCLVLCDATLNAMNAGSKAKFRVVVADEEDSDDDKLENNMGGLAVSGDDEKIVVQTQNDTSHAGPSRGVVFPCVLFENFKDALISLINQEQKGITGAYYIFIQPDIAGVWAKKHKNEVESGNEFSSELTVSNDWDQWKNKKYNNPWGALKALDEAKIPVFCNALRHGSYENMHHKFFVFGRNVGGRKLLWTGSYNCTNAAEGYNWENVIILNDKKVIAGFEEEVGRLKEHRKRINDDVRAKN